MVGDPGGLKRTISEFLDRRLRPLQEQLDQVAAQMGHASSDLGDLRSAVARLEAEQRAQRDLVQALLGTVNLISRRPRQRARLRVLFLIHYMEAWDSVADVIALMRADDDFEPIVASIPRRLPGSRDFIDEELTHERLEAVDVPHIRLEGDSFIGLETIKLLDPDLIFRQSQWDPDYPPGFATEHLSFARLALIPYETVNIVENMPTGTTVRDSATDSRYHRHCWAVFCANEFMRQRADEKSLAAGSGHFVVTGHPKVPRLRRAIASSARDAERPFTVLWSAHHSIDEHWTKFGLFPTMAAEMVGWARSAPEMRFVFSPHPSLLSRMATADPPLTPESVAAFRTAWEALPNTELFRGGTTGQYGELFARTDALITDGLSMLVEYQLANKPVIYVEREGHRPFNEVGRIAQRGFHTVGSTEEARTLVNRFAAGQPDPLATSQQEVVAQLFAEHDSAQKVVDHIRAHWASDADGS
jgi:hypothetical protein